MPILAVQLEDQAVRETLQALLREVEPWRAEQTLELMQQALAEAVSLTPVETGQARAGWVGALEQSGGQPPAGWEGGQPDATRIAEGRGQSHLRRSDSTDATEIQAVNAVAYIGILEHGGRNRAAHRMAQRSVQQVRPTLAGRLAELLERAR